MLGKHVPSVRDDASLRELVKRLPEWLRADLSSSDLQKRERAEDVLVAMIGASGSYGRLRESAVDLRQILDPDMMSDPILVGAGV